MSIALVRPKFECIYEGISRKNYMKEDPPSVRPKLECVYEGISREDYMKGEDPP